MIIIIIEVLLLVEQEACLCDARVEIVAENVWCHNRQKSRLDVKLFILSFSS